MPRNCWRSAMSTALWSAAPASRPRNSWRLPPPAASLAAGQARGRRTGPPPAQWEDTMKLGSLAATLALVVATLIAAAGDGRAADIKILCSNGFQAVMAVLGPQYEKASGHRLVVSYGLAAVLGRQIEAGETFDLAILAPPQIDALITQGRIAPQSRLVLARSGIGVMVRSGAPKPDVSTVDAFKQT